MAAEAACVKECSSRVGPCSAPPRGHRGPISVMLAVRERRPENRQSQPSHCL